MPMLPDGRQVVSLVIPRWLTRSYYDDAKETTMQLRVSRKFKAEVQAFCDERGFDYAQLVRYVLNEVMRDAQPKVEPFQIEHTRTVIERE